MPVVRLEKRTIIDYDNNLSVAHGYADNGGVIVAFDNNHVEEQRKFDPKVLIYFSTAQDVKLLIMALIKAKKMLKQQLILRGVNFPTES